MTYTIRPDTQGDTLVSSRNPIRTNFEVIQDRWEVNHQEINVGGKHIFVEMPDQASIPSGLVGSEGTIYVKNANGRSQIFYTNENSGNEYQLTRANNGDFPNFGNAAFAAGNNAAAGWTFLPGRGSLGGMLFQYGLTTTLANAGDRTITFPKAFTGVPFSVTCTMVRSSQNKDVLYVNTITNTNFVITNTSSGNTAYWMAIGV